ncbi:MAG: LD-carboxypeptidase [bacterium]
MNLVKPSPLKKGDTIHIVASSSPFERAAFEEGVTLLENWGFKVAYNDNIFDKIPYLAGTDERRAEELITALECPNTKAILFARGGYGAMRLLPLLDKNLKTPKAKIIIGYSDITCLLSYLYQRYQWMTFYGPVVSKDISNTMHEQTMASLQSHLTATNLEKTLTFNNAHSLYKGRATAPLTGGCLTLIVSLLGTSYEINTENKILFIEDTNEKPYEIDRMLTHLKLAGKFDHCSGLIFGSLKGPNPDEHYIETIKGITKEYNIPILFNIPVGHSNPKLTLPLGATITLNTENNTITFEESFYNE